MHREATDSARVLHDLRDLRAVAAREHGPRARSTQRIEEALRRAEQEDRGSPSRGRSEPLERSRRN